ncbi:hypothetical protein M422DRAFT_260987 [Sphaerobolus stellatus SS14]|uniref:MARVEL domain-containing protein n=1 Tax=Sphaerobolus stellatus (strain SS14) TaxID=990650 RepID=A0A0C9VH19_SPHS4|nr:hypothetical protein M422DRAFT_271273 [Sphaerobolus stellatus SS14]KIJ36636.1 hypothetical protein M422DRAFT_260987 [Sphaerobolus stellatus SS14]
MSISHIGKTRFKIYGALLLVDIIVLGLSGHINQFQEFYYKADLIPFGLALATAIWLSVMILLDVKSRNAATAKPAFELTWLGIMTLLWLGFNAFSTNRWRSIGWSVCKTIPHDAQYAAYRTWCTEVQAIRAFIWIEWVLLLLAFIHLLRWTLRQQSDGRTDIWSTSFSRFEEGQAQAGPIAGTGRAQSEFLQWEKFDRVQQPSRLNNNNTPTDPFQSEPAMTYPVEPVQSRDSSVPPMGTAYGRAQQAQRQQQPQAYDNGYAAYQTNGTQYAQGYPQYGGQSSNQYGSSAHGY